MDTTDGFAPKMAMEECMDPPEQLVDALLMLARVHRHAARRLQG